MFANKRESRKRSGHVCYLTFGYAAKQKRPYPKMNRVAMVVCMNKILKCLSIAINLISSKIRASLPSAAKEALVGMIEFGG
ncbi:hypothetical protein EFQ23_08595 [Limosilactobacillus fermentum]|nr:hypothetical protein [Limosilactobacillus fermentum]PPX65223.1 hypothetical protein C5O28_08730 [Limosilactobacillus fermentum]